MHVMNYSYTSAEFPHFTVTLTVTAKNLEATHTEENFMIQFFNNLTDYTIFQNLERLKNEDTNFTSSLHDFTN